MPRVKPTDPRYSFEGSLHKTKQRYQHTFPKKMGDLIWLADRKPIGTFRIIVEKDPITGEKKVKIRYYINNLKYDINDILDQVNADNNP